MQIVSNILYFYGGNKIHTTYVINCKRILKRFVVWNRISNSIFFFFFTSSWTCATPAVHTNIKWKRVEKKKKKEEFYLKRRRTYEYVYLCYDAYVEIRLTWAAATVFFFSTKYRLCEHYVTLLGLVGYSDRIKIYREKRLWPIVILYFMRHRTTL